MFRGLILIIAASVLFGLIPSGNKYVLLSGMSSDCVLFYQVITMILATWLAIITRKEPYRIPLLDAIKLFLLGAVGIGGTDYLLNLSYGYLPVSTVVMLHFLYPTIVLMITGILFHEKLSLLTICAMLLSIVGLLFIADNSGTINLTGVLLALSSGITYAVFTVANEYGKVNQYSIMVKLFYMSFGTAIPFGAKTIFSHHFSVPADLTVALVLIGVVGFGSASAFYLITAGIKQIGAGHAAFLNLLEPVIGIAAGVIVYQESIARNTGVGCICILLSILFIAMDEKKTRTMKSRHI